MSCESVVSIFWIFFCFLGVFSSNTAAKELSSHVVGMNSKSTENVISNTYIWVSEWHIMLNEQKQRREAECWCYVLCVWSVLFLKYYFTFSCDIPLYFTFCCFMNFCFRCLIWNFIFPSIHFFHSSLFLVFYFTFHCFSDSVHSLFQIEEEKVAKQLLYESSPRDGHDNWW